MFPARELEASASGSSTRSVLMVEDEVLIRLAVADYLRDCGYQVCEAANASEAKALLKTLPIDLVFSDVNMPGENGLALAEWIMLRHPAIPIVLTSGRDRFSESKLPAHVTILPKPYRFDDLNRLIQSLLRKAETGG
jgi:DNA-binding NtrC family response regulator